MGLPWGWGRRRGHTWLNHWMSSVVAPLGKMVCKLQEPSAAPEVRVMRLGVAKHPSHFRIPTPSSKNLAKSQRIFGLCKVTSLLLPFSCLATVAGCVQCLLHAYPSHLPNTQPTFTTQPDFAFPPSFWAESLRQLDYLVASAGAGRPSSKDVGSMVHRVGSLPVAWPANPEILSQTQYSGWQ